MLPGLDIGYRATTTLGIFRAAVHVCEDLTEGSHGCANVAQGFPAIRRHHRGMPGHGSGLAKGCLENPQMGYVAPRKLERSRLPCAPRLRRMSCGATARSQAQPGRLPGVCLLRHWGLRLGEGDVRAMVRELGSRDAAAVTVSFGGGPRPQRASSIMFHPR